MKSELLEIKNISKTYVDKFGYSINLLEDVSFSINKNEFTSIIGEKDSGISSFLRIISGIEKPTDGKIISESKIAYIPSKPSSYPWLSVQQNISFNSEFTSNEIKETIKLVGLHGYENHFPNNRSVGFRFRISLARAIAYKPSIIVIDEPLNELNSTTKKEIYKLLRKITKQIDISIVFGTQNITEAIYLSDRVLVMQSSPSIILKDLVIDLKGDRELSIINDKKFFGIKNEIENTLITGG